MLKFLLLCIAIGTMSSEASQRNNKRSGGSGSYASSGGYAGAGGYAGSYDGNDDYDDSGTGDFTGTGFGYAPDYGFIDPYLFHQQLTAQILAQQAAQNHALASTFSAGDAFVRAEASSLPDGMQIQQQIAQQQGFYDGHRHQSHNYNKGGHKSHRYAPNYAAASGSIGPGGFYQTAFISPENPGNPNINNRFSGSSGPGGYKGVSVSSFSSSSDVDGKRTSQRGAQTTVNDNGRVTTYRVNS